MTDPVAFFPAVVMEHAPCECELADILEMPQSSVSRHVRIIRKAGPVKLGQRHKPPVCVR